MLNTGSIRSLLALYQVLRCSGYLFLATHKISAKQISLCKELGVAFRHYVFLQDLVGVGDEDPGPLLAVFLFAWKLILGPLQEKDKGGPWSVTSDQVYEHMAFETRLLTCVV